MMTIKWKRVSSLTLMFLAAVLTLTGIALYISPQGRVALWHDWHLLGMDKADYEAMHITASLLFILMGWLHTYFNWRTIAAYLKDRSRRMNGLNREFLVSLSLSAVFVASALYALPPVYQVVTLGSATKAAWEENLGTPPYGHAEETSLKAFAAWMGIDPGQAASTLRDAGIRVGDSGLTLKAIAVDNGTTPSSLYALLNPASMASGTEGGKAGDAGDAVIKGLGHLTLADFSRRESADLCTLVANLRGQGLEASPDTTLKSLAVKMELTPSNVRDRLLVKSP